MALTFSQFFVDAEMEAHRGRAENGGGMNSMHEAYAVLLEEVDELWEQVKKKPRDRNPGAIYKELVQIAAIAAGTAMDFASEDHTTMDDLVRMAGFKHE